MGNAPEQTAKECAIFHFNSETTTEDTFEAGEEMGE